jgi:ABC-type transport system involved in cytochrome bd biosynthesis fused ATPase/permease subunit
MTDKLQQKINNLELKLNDIQKKQYKSKKLNKVINFSFDLIVNFIASALIVYVFIKIEKDYLKIQNISNVFNFFFILSVFSSAVYISIKKHFI